MSLISNLLEVLWSKLLIKFGIRLDESVIPEGPYCYKPDLEKNKSETSFDYHIIPCPYYKKISKNFNGCKYMGIVTDDFVFEDGCKICGVNKGYDIE